MQFYLKTNNRLEAKKIDPKLSRIKKSGISQQLNYHSFSINMYILGFILVQFEKLQKHEFVVKVIGLFQILEHILGELSSNPQKPKK